MTEAITAAFHEAALSTLARVAGATSPEEARGWYELAQTMLTTQEPLPPPPPPPPEYVATLELPQRIITLIKTAMEIRGFDGPEQTVANLAMLTAADLLKTERFGLGALSLVKHALARRGLELSGRRHP